VILLRHGKVLEKLGRQDEAQALLLRVLEVPVVADVHYRARMTLGGMAERGGELESAIRHYEAAVNLIPSWQVAHLTLGHVLHASGAHDRAREMLDAALSLKIEEADEFYGGWWSYELGISLRFEPLLKRMRAGVRR
jgi:tetratricopeptide (TPR) repeat protein